ncbi:hypothetical protein V501_04409 [Pseudogymnoascus sp. VKM F-4519 (FW-2642)]|nr:hypothetical protein V501_04409 [Pseudogymnoascus sp. VKM F-4519 (FW-2642)]
MNNQPPQPPSGLDRERELEEQHLREQQHIMRQQEEMAQRRDHEDRERHRRDQQQQQYQSVPQHQNNTGTIPIHQPVASRLAGAIHSPGGLLANHNGSSQPGPLGAPTGPGNAFGGPLHAEANRSIQPHNQQQNPAAQQQHQIFGPNIINHVVGPAAPIGVNQAAAPGFGGPLQPEAAARSMQQMPFGGPGGAAHPAQGAPALGQGQQPILNDALSYLDQVKVQFVDQPDVYNRFLDIMKDFKSQAIDTPGVINRVSDLFAGHPNLIQGFNTFLPPGYRIECGAGNDPNTIRVTTPMGTTVQSITGAGRALPDGPQAGANGGYYPPQRGNSNNWQQPQHSIESPEAVFSPQARNGVPPYAQAQAPNAVYESQQAAVNAHQQEQRGVSQLQSAIATATGHPVARNALTPTPTAQGAGMNGAAAQQPGVEKRGPVEFNHAISYVNKIKNRFQDKPEIYKQFLEILQTYQRESKPIQDVYAQVTTLFGTAPDLLEDFKQFLPESAAQAKAAAAKAAEDAAAIGLAGVSQAPQPLHVARGEQKLPPVGNFLPPSTSKEGKKRPRPPNAPAPVPMGALGDAAASRASIGQAGSGNKRMKTSHGTRMVEGAPAVSPTLTPQKPQPMSPLMSTATQQSEVAFFDKVKKYLSNKQIFAEFLKLCNLFSQDLIDKNVLVHKVSNFIGQNAELMDFFKRFVNYSGPEEVIENRPRAPTGKVSLSNCRGLGPSYRLLPKRERLKACSGRDEMCYSVLNDDWASHPTWASEDSGFVAHRKNHFEEGLHRIEEERHDYDFNIEANAKVIQLLEPIAHQILNLQAHEMPTFRMPSGFGGQSQSIYKRIFKKIYGTEKGNEVAADLFKDPIAVVPVVLARLKQKDEEWRFTQREWDKVWHVQTQAMYLKSLDHMGISVKGADKKLLAPRAMTELIRNKHEEQKRQRSLTSNVPRYQFLYTLDDDDVIIDVVRFAILYVMNANQHSPAERDRIADFLEDFVPTFFGISVNTVRDRVKDISRGSPDEEMEDTTPAELSNGRSSRRANGKTDHTLLRGVLERGRNGTRGRGQKESSIASGSKESTPDTGSIAEDEETAGDPMDESGSGEAQNERWLGRPPSAAALQGAPLEASDFELKADQPFYREWYSLYANQTIFQFFSIFEVLYRRLKALKDGEAAVTEEVRRIKAPKPAKEIGLLEERNDWFSQDSSETYYNRALMVMEEFVLGDVEEVKYQDFLRTYYLQRGWALYTISDLLKNICRYATTCSSTDSKEKTPLIINSFLTNRTKDETTFNQEIDLRKKVEKIVGDADMYLIRYSPKRRQATTQLITKDESTFDLTDMERKDRWKYYTSSFVRIEPTEGVPLDRIRRSVLTRNLSPHETDTDSGLLSQSRKPLLWAEDLTLRICVNTYRLTYKTGTSEWFVYSDGVQDEVAARQTTEKRNQRFREKFEMNSRWMENKSQQEVQKTNEDFKKWISEGPAAAE